MLNHHGLSVEIIDARREKYRDNFGSNTIIHARKSTCETVLVHHFFSIELSQNEHVVLLFTCHRYEFH